MYGEQVGVVSIFPLYWSGYARLGGRGVGLGGQAESKLFLPSGIDSGTVLLVSDRDVHQF